MILCFDLDRTLINSDRAHTIAFNEGFEKAGLKKINNKKLAEAFGPVKEKVIRKFYPKITKKKLKEVVDIHDKLLVKKTYKYAKILPYTKKILKKLKKDNHKIVIISNCKHKNIIYLLKGTKIDKKIFSAIIGNDDVKKGKPSPNGIFKAEKIIRNKIDIVIGDSIYDIKAAKRAKRTSIAVLTGHYSKSILQKQKPDYIIKNLTKLPTILNKINQ